MLANRSLYKKEQLAAVGFEPTPPKRLVPKTSALDHSATLPYIPILVSQKQLISHFGIRCLKQKLLCEYRI